MTKPLLVLGSANADLVVEVGRRPAGGETVLGGDTVVLPGGKGANTAVAAARVGASVALIGALGGDGYGSLLRESLESSGVDTSLVKTSQRPTGIAYITVTPDGENSIVVSPGANADVSSSDVDAVSFDGAQVLTCSLEVPLETVIHAIDVAHAAGVRTVLNLSPVAEIPAETLGKLTTLIVNEHEAAQLASGFEGMLRLGPKSAVVTLGARGAAVVTGEGITEVPSIEVTEVVDTTGAGDAFAGALSARLAEGDTLVDAAKYAAEVAALSVTKAGAQPSYPTAAEVSSPAAG
ncbi:ribokinase [Lentzea aerocolonigenes]|uniref:ribokinase n=1 Tax=Lentzea aerocolonigenes TaxID=68170 RepID=UPI0004C41C84|nr:ribokinase [Lentzea aerocolonigenes]MCP2244858.1 ribokinase [Lentzea aerocolonigenes]MCP2245247.1 ribokinase [Lentzea aerocolonigenes]